MTPLKESELVAVDGSGLAILERGDGSRPAGARQQERKLTKRAARPEHVEQDAVVAQVKPQVTAQIVGVQVAQVQRVKAAVSAQRHTVQLANAKRFSILLRAQIR